MSMGIGTLHNKSSKQKLNTKSTTELEIVGVSKCLPYDLWQVNCFPHQGYDIRNNVIYQDNENAIKALRDSLGKFHGGLIVPEHPAKGESSSNGVVEQGGQAVRGLLRTLKEAIEEKAATKLTDTDAVVQWGLRWAAMLLSRFTLGRIDGLTPFQRRRGRPCRAPVVPFGEKGPLSHPEGQIQTREQIRQPLEIWNLAGAVQRL